MSKDALIVKLKRREASANASMFNFKSNLEKSPAYALSWSLDAFAAAAMLKITEQMLNALSSETCSVKSLYELLMDRVRNRSKYPPQSTSPTSNLMEQYELAACSEIADDCERYLSVDN
jgi:hypothetical protein